jgi:hypothetical protein
MFPAYIFETIMETFSRPVRPYAPAPVQPFICLARRIHRVKPVAKFGLPILHLSSSRRSPSGPFNPSGS